MPPPRPLAATEPADLDLSCPTAPASARFGDIYFSVEGGLAESEAVFLRGCGLPKTFRPGFVIAEAGFGTGLNLLAAWRAWRASGRAGRLHFVSMERYPLDREQLARALASFPSVAPLAHKLVAAWPGRVRGVHRREFSDLTLDLWHMDVADALPEMRLRADAWFLDGFSPARNPDMWSAETLARIAKLTLPGGRLASFTVAGHVRRALADAGLEVERRPGFGRKRHRLEARKPGRREASPEPRPVILGGGIAGTSVAHALLREGIRPNLIRSPDHAAQAASANPRALVKPRLDLQDRLESRFFLSAWGFAQHLYPAVSRGITHRLRTASEAERYTRLALNRPLPARDFEVQGEVARFPTSPVIDPVAVCAAWSAGAKRVDARAADWHRDTDGDWVVTDGTNTLARGTHLVLASGLHLKDALSRLNLRASRGQLSWADVELADATTYGGYAIPVGARTLLGATHDRVGRRDPYRLDAADDARNARTLREHLGLVATALAPARASVRVNTADTLPVMGEVEPGLWVLGALGSRGFSHAPLLGAALAARILERPVPLTARQSARLSPRRLVPKGPADRLAERPA